MDFQKGGKCTYETTTSGTPPESPLFINPSEFCNPNTFPHSFTEPEFPQMPRITLPEEEAQPCDYYKLCHSIRPTLQKQIKHELRCQSFRPTENLKPEPLRLLQQEILPKFEYFSVGISQILIQLQVLSLNFLFNFLLNFLLNFLCFFWKFICFSFFRTIFQHTFLKKLSQVKHLKN